MCGKTPMRLRFPTDTSSNSSSGWGNLLSHLSSSNPAPQLPATKAVNELIAHEKADVSSSSESCSDKSGSLNANTPWGDFPTIEWNLSDDNGDEDDCMEADLSIASAPARFEFQPDTSSRSRPTRGSLVRSISLVSSILKEMGQRSSPTSAVSSKKRHKKASAHRKEFKSHSTPAHRLIALNHPATGNGLRVGHHEASQKFFL